jgi:hypothetical protein
LIKFRRPYPSERVQQAKAKLEKATREAALKKEKVRGQIHLRLSLRLYYNFKFLRKITHIFAGRIRRTEAKRRGTKKEGISTQKR